MLNKKGAVTPDILSYFIVLVFGSVTIMGIAYFIIAPAMGERAKVSVTESIAEFDENLFLFNYLRYPVGEKTMADLVIKAYMENDKGLLKQETIDFLNELYDKETRVCCKTKLGRLRATVPNYYWKEAEECGDAVSKEYCIKWRIYVNDESFVSSPYTAGKEKTIHETSIPNYYNLEPINFKFIFY